jgi:hypothetical protein
MPEEIGAIAGGEGGAAVADPTPEPEIVPGAEPAPEPEPSPEPVPGEEPKVEPKPGE